MPIWIAGVAAYYPKRPIITNALHWILFLLCLITTLTIVALAPIIPYGVGVPPLTFAGGFFTDWIVGLFTAIALWLIPSGGKSMFTPIWIKKFRKLADLTFPIYLLHFPLFVLWRAIFPFQRNNMSQLCIAIISVLFFTIILGTILERQRSIWNKLFIFILSKFNIIIFVNTIFNPYKSQKL